MLDPLMKTNYILNNKIKIQFIIQDNNKYKLSRNLNKNMKISKQNHKIYKNTTKDIYNHRKNNKYK